MFKERLRNIIPFRTLSSIKKTGHYSRSPTLNI